MKKKQASSTIYIIFFIIMFLAFIAFAVDGAIVFTNRMKLQNITEQSALAGAAEFDSEYELSSSSTSIVAIIARIMNIRSNVSDTAEDTFDMLKQDGLSTATVTVDINVASKAVSLTSEYISQPFFLAFLGVNGINLEAKATAVSEELDVTANYSGVNWLTTTAAYLSDVLSVDASTYNDTAILLPLGDYDSASYVDGEIYFGLLDSDDDNPLSLGPGGYVTIKLPAPIVNKPGNDLYIKEAGDALEGYMVFAGIDQDPSDPYISVDNPGSGIYWINITDSGSAEDHDLTNPFGTAVTELSTSYQDKIYGSAYFDIENSGISLVKYIRIIDDNDESAFTKSDDGNYYETMIYGEASTATAGADIDAVIVLNHVRLTTN